jgi:hypothetical protein
MPTTPYESMAAGRSRRSERWMGIQTLDPRNRSNRLRMRSAANKSITFNDGPGGAAWRHPMDGGARVDKLTETGVPLRFIRP